MIVEPVAANMGVVPPEPGFLEGLRELCDTSRRAARASTRSSPGSGSRTGARSRYFGVTPDLTVFGKVMGGGFPCAAFGGRRDLMEQLAPTGPVYQAGTLSGNPVAVAAGIAALDLARDRDPYRRSRPRRPTSPPRSIEAFAAAAVPVTINRAGSLFSVFFGDEAGARLRRRRPRRPRALRVGSSTTCSSRGVYLPPSGYELWTLSTTHGPDEVTRVVEAVTSFRG